VDFKNSRKTRICNVPRHVLIVVPSNGGDKNVEVRLNVLLDFNGNTVNKQYDCESNLPYISRYFHAVTKGKINEVLGFKSENIHLFNSCQVEKCFHADTKGLYEFGHPWKEPPDCVPPTQESKE
jgi:hypothetical protein